MITEERTPPAPGPARDADKLVSMLVRPGADPGGPPCIVAGGRTWTRGQVRAEVARTAERLRAAGVTGGSRVLALLDHDPAGVFFLAAASALGLRVLMPYNLQAAAVPEWRTIVTTARPDAVVHLKADPAGLDELRGLGAPVVRLAPEDTPAPEGAGPVVEHPAPVGNFLVLFTSGTTGAPKAISISEELICRRVETVTGHLLFSADARIFMSGLLNNTTGVIFSFGALLHGAVLVFPRGRDLADWPAQVAEHRVTHVMLRPIAMKRFLAAAPGADLSSLRVVAYGAAAMPRAVLEEGRRALPCAWVQGYGLSETFGPFSWLDEQAHREQRYRRHAYNVGRPDDTLEVRLLPVEGHPEGVGEVALRGAARMEGYLDAATGAVEPPGEWLRTGDLGLWSPDGDLVLKGRLNASLMSANGHRIYPEEVEAVFAEIPGVDEAVLVGVAGRETLAERPVACLAGPLARRAPDEIRAVVTERLTGVLSREKWPDLIWASPEPFPKSANDKVRKGEVVAAVDPAALIALTGEDVR
ncbi:AMP-binding protein [Kitasatospora sp. NPDC059571]|uniref:class I adenylate-forming enzyme family protein n=1 Tax=Kitasatospora sp. NPDC059571 TaxID=3346871 RepID=UPI0036CC0881